MVIIDSSAWIAFLRGSDGPTRPEVRRQLAEGEVAICGVIEMEILGGARNESNLEELERLFASVERFSIFDDDFLRAAELYRSCRRKGKTIRSLEDCLIATVALREGLEILHEDRDFDSLAEVTGVQARRAQAS